MWTALALTLLLANPNPDPADAPLGEPEAWFRRWAESMSFERFRAEFETVRTPANRPVERLIGCWDLRLRPTVAQYMSYRRYLGDRASYERLASWNAGKGEGRLFHQSAESVRGEGLISVGSPTPFSQADLPADMHFFFHQDRPLSRYLQRVQLRVEAPAGRPGIIAACLGGEGPGLIVYLLDPSRPQPILELRSYTREPPPWPILNPAPGEPIRLPPPFEDACLFENKVVLESRPIESPDERKLPIPIAWEVRHCLLPPEERLVIRLLAGTIEVDGPQAPHHYEVSWPVGTKVFDAPKGEAFVVAEGKLWGEAEVVRESYLNRILGELGVAGHVTDAEGSDPIVPSACGANAAYIALCMLGRPEPIARIVDRLGVSVEEPSTSAQKLLDVLGSIGLSPVAAEIPEAALRPERLEPLVLHARRLDDRGDHFLVIDDFDALTDTVRVIDPPSLPYRASLPDVRAAWTGKAILVHPASLARLDAARIRSEVARIALGAAAFLAVLALLWRGRARRRRTVFSPVALVLAVLGLVQPGCGAEDDGRSSSRLLEVLGPSRIDLGRVKRSKVHIQHDFQLRNRGPRLIRIADIRKSCGCLAVEAECREVAAGETTRVTMVLDTNLVAGRRRSTALVILDDPSADPVALEMDAFVEFDYDVRIAPGLWAIEPEAERASLVRRIFEVTEFSSRVAEATEPVAVTSTDPRLRVVGLSPWTVRGWRGAGYSRSATLTLELRLADGRGVRGSEGGTARAGSSASAPRSGSPDGIGVAMGSLPGDHWATVTFERGQVPDEPAAGRSGRTEDEGPATEGIGAISANKERAEARLLIRRL